MFGVFYQSISGVLVIMVMIAVGYVLTVRGWFNDYASRLIARLVTQIALPAYMIYTITKQFTVATLRTTLPELRFPVVSMLILYALAIATYKVFRVRQSHKGLFESMFLNSNTVFVGLPVNMALFGTKSLPYVLVYYMANTTFFWTLGVYLIQKDGVVDQKIEFWPTVKKIFSPPLLGFMFGVVLVLLKIKLPNFLMEDMQYIGGLTIPLSMIFIGIAIANVGITNLTLNRANIAILMGRFLIAPIVMSLLVLPTDMPLLMKQVFIMQSAMPVMTNAPVVAKLYGADANFAAIMVTETTLLSLIVIPILMVLLKSFTQQI